MRASAVFGAAAFIAEVVAEWTLAVLATPGALASAAAHAATETARKAPGSEHRSR